MCGINGIVYSKKSERNVSEDLLTKMRDVLHHRGPDDARVFISKNVGLGHRRLSIVDVSHGAQPMSNEDDTLKIVFNGEIYNHADYRNYLTARGHVYQTNCDTETILHLYEEHGERCIESLRGMFAFAIWDDKREKLFIARDRLGVKPLYYVHDTDGNLFFASEIKALLAANAVKPEINFRVLPEQFANHGTNGEETLFVGIKRLLPAHTLTWQNGAIKIEKYWDVNYQPKFENRRDKDLVVEWHELFREAVKLRLMADVPLGMFLSGGIDSSAICAEMSKMVDAPIKTFSVAFAEREANELEFARIVADKFKTEHHEITVSPAEFFDAIPKLVWHEDEPLGFIACVPLYFVSKLAAEKVKVVLTGEGADEMLGGYGRYRKTILNASIGKSYENLTPRFVREMVRGNLGNLPASVERKLNRTFLNVSPNLESIYLNNFAVFPAEYLDKLFTHDAKKQIGNVMPFDLANHYLSETDAVSLLDKMLYSDTKTYLHELLMKQDRMSMAASIESRVPFLDHKLVEFMARLPEKMKLRGSNTKHILREAMKNVLPNEILTRPKMGFPVPVGRWLKNEFRQVIDEYVLSPRVFERNIFVRETLQNIVDEHCADARNHEEKLWALINFEIWARQFIDGENSV